jgi:heme-degrading monooxygenase HmoA
MAKSQNTAVSGLGVVEPQAFIAVKAPVITLINVLEVPPEREAELVEILEKATDEVIRHLPGFVSANIHRSADKKHVANYAQWRSMEDFERMLANPDAQAHIRDATAIAKAAPFVYHVHSVHLSSGK